MKYLVSADDEKGLGVVCRDREFNVNSARILLSFCCNIQEKLQHRPSSQTGFGAVVVEIKNIVDRNLRVCE